MAATQTEFRAALLDPERPVPGGLVDGLGQPATRRFAVYRNNVTVALIEALRTGFPVLCKLLGDQNFDQVARLFARAHPPSSPLMMRYGAEVPTFLEGFAPLAHIGYLGDVARLELALRRSYHAADAPPLDPARLGALPPAALMRTRLHLAPAVQVVPSNWPIHDIWRYNTVPDAPKPRAVAQSVLVTRAEFDPVPHVLTPAQFAWVSAIQDGAALEDAVDAAAAHDPDFNLAPVLSLLVQHNALTDLTPPKE
ncbi:DNA-binding domain-containing protein [uncultured Tateyamaria sp.]|uniref:HvfC/BufC N-terminal domain-containing protein n=1 Tax=uncultured Tateyamaria sp. TaxID=455651 RepID=UPI00260D2526|nr:DNA-binding domain-containing protein [uncultured Tateyamaria sp.]